jgi:hypothetical protein
MAIGVIFGTLSSLFIAAPLMQYFHNQRDAKTAAEWRYMSSRHRPTEGPLWIFPKQDPSWTKKIIDEFNIHPVTAQVLSLS